MADSRVASPRAMVRVVVSLVLGLIALATWVPPAPRKRRGRPHRHAGFISGTSPL